MKDYIEAEKHLNIAGETYAKTCKELNGALTSKQVISIYRDYLAKSEQRMRRLKGITCALRNAAGPEWRSSKSNPATLLREEYDLINDKDTPAKLCVESVAAKALLRVSLREIT